jgi:hypothetical protein
MIGQQRQSISCRAQLFCCSRSMASFSSSVIFAQASLDCLRAFKSSGRVFRGFILNALTSRSRCLLEGLVRSFGASE